MLASLFTLLMPKQQKSANSPFNVISQRLYHPPLHKYTERNSIAYITQYLSIFVFPMTKRQNLGNSPFNIIAPHSSHRPCTYTPKGTQFRRSPDYLAYIQCVSKRLRDHYQYYITMDTLCLKKVARSAENLSVINLFC